LSKHLPKNIFLTLPQHYHRVVTITHNATLQCMFTRCFRVLLQDVFIHCSYCIQQSNSRSNMQANLQTGKHVFCCISTPLCRPMCLKLRCTSHEWVSNNVWHITNRNHHYIAMKNRTSNSAEAWVISHCDIGMFFDARLGPCLSRQPC